MSTTLPSETADAHSSKEKKCGGERERERQCVQGIVQDTCKPKLGERERRAREEGHGVVGRRGPACLASWRLGFIGNRFLARRDGGVFLFL